MSYYDKIENDIIKFYSRSHIFLCIEDNNKFKCSEYNSYKDVYLHRNK